MHGCFCSKHFHNETEHWGCTKHLHADYGLDTVVAVTNQSHHLHKTVSTNALMSELNVIIKILQCHQKI